jgi:hypothetical protein
MAGTRDRKLAAQATTTDALLRKLAAIREAPYCTRWRSQSGNGTAFLRG